MAEAVIVEIRGRDTTARATKAAESRFKRLGDSLKSISLGQVAALGGVTVAVQQTLDQFAKFDTRLREISTLLTNVTEQDIQTMGSEIKTLSVEFGQSIDAMAKAKYDVISAGFTGAAESADVLRESAKLAVVGVTDISKTADVLTSVINAYGKENLSAKRASDLLFTTVRLGKTTVDSLSTTIGTAAAVAPTLGVSLEELSAGVATLTAQGLSTEETVVSIQAAMTGLINPTDAAQKAINDLGFETGKAAVEQLGLLGTIQELTAGMNEADIAALFPNIRAMRAIFPLIGGAADTFADNLAAMQDAAGATDEGFQKMTESIGFKMNQMRQRVTVALLEVGQAMLPLANAVVSIVEAFSSMDTRVQTSIIIIGGLGAAFAAIVPILAALKVSFIELNLALGPTGWLILGVTALTTAFFALSPEIEDATGELSEFNTEVGLLNLSTAETELASLREEISRLSDTSPLDEFTGGLDDLTKKMVEFGDVFVPREIENAELDHQNKINQLLIREAELLERITELKNSAGADLGGGAGGVALQVELDVDTEMFLAKLRETRDSLQDKENELTVEASIELAGTGKVTADLQNELTEVRGQLEITQGLIEETLLNIPTPELPLAELYEQQARDIVEARMEMDEEIGMNEFNAAVERFENLQSLENDFLKSSEQVEMESLEARLAAVDEHWRQRADLVAIWNEEIARIENENFLAGLETAEGFINDIGALWDQYGAVRRQQLQNELDEQLDAADRAYDIEVSNITRLNTVGGQLTQTGQAQLETLEAQHQERIAGINRDFEEKEKEAARGFKAVKIAQALSNTALGVTKALSSAPFPLNLIAAAVTAAAGAVQVAQIRAQPFQFGTAAVGNPFAGVNFSPSGVDTVPALLEPTEAVIPGRIAQENREALEEILGGGAGPGRGQQIIINFDASFIDAQGVDDFVNSDNFRDSVARAINNRDIQIETDGSIAEVVT